MPIDNPELAGTEKNGVKSTEYCKYCYQDGKFIQPDMTLEEMQSIVKVQMAKRKIDQNLVDMALNVLPTLKRWKTKTQVKV